MKENNKIDDYNLEVTKDKNKLFISTRNVNFYFNLVDYQKKRVIKKIIIVNKETQTTKYLSDIVLNTEEFIKLIKDTFAELETNKLNNQKELEKKVLELSIELEIYCNRYNYRFHYELDNFIIITNYSRWKFNFNNYISTKEIILYHGNSRISAKNDKSQFHKQEVSIISLEELFDYIKKHDQKYLNSKEYFKKK